MTSSHRNKLTALICTIAFHVLLVVLLFTLYLRYTGAEDPERTWPPVDSAELLFGGEYVMLGDSPEASSTDNAPDNSQSITQNISQPKPAAPTHQSVTTKAAKSTQEPTSKVPQPKITEPKHETPKQVQVTKPAQEAKSTKKETVDNQQQENKEQQVAKAIANKVQFGKSGSGSNSNNATAGVGGSGSGRPGSPNGNSTTGALAGSPGFSLKGRSLASWHTPPSAPLGTITIRVSVNRQGKVTAATYLSGTGAAAASSAARKNCEDAALRSQFSVDTNAPANQTGTITYRFQ